MNGKSLLFLALSLLVLAGCASTKPTQTVTSSNVRKDSTEAQKTFAKATKATRPYDGLFTLYQDTTNGTLLLSVSKSQLGKEYIYFSQTTDGVPEAGHFRGLYRDGQIFSIRKHFNRLEFVNENTNFYFDPGNALSRASQANISPSVLYVQEIVAEDSATGRYLIKAQDLFLTEALTQIKPTPNPRARPDVAFSLGQLSKAKTRYSEIKNYPKNTDVVVEYVFENPAPLVRGRPEITDPRNVSIRVRHSLIEVPSNDFTARFDDPRVGFFTQQVTDLTSTSATPYRDLVNRWHLVKKDPGAALSEPIEPIVFWIENTTPAELRETIRDAVLSWNEAFEAAGFKNAIQVNVQPDDADWDAGDIRYNVLRWTSSPTPPFGGYGPSFVNPRTGQILGADVMLEYVYLTNRIDQEKLFETAALGLTDGAEASDPRLCAAGRQLHASMMAGRFTLLAEGASKIEVDTYLKEALYYLVLHEVGHTLGLNHNFRATQMLSPEEINDLNKTRATGLAGSVMDYPGVNLSRPGQRQGGFFPARPGPYDIWAIQFGYSPDLDNTAARDRHLARSTEPALAFANDADDMRMPGKGIDPRVMLYDQSSDAITYATDRLDRVGMVMGKVRDRYQTRGQSYHELRNAYLALTSEQQRAGAILSRYIGGVYVDRAMQGQPGAGRPFTPVSLKDQQRAMAGLAKYLFAPDAFRAPAGLYDHLQMQRRGFEFFSNTEDPKLHQRALLIQKSVLDHLLHPVVLARISDSRLYGNQYPLPMLMGDLTRAIFSDDAATDVNTFRQNLQIEYVNRLATMAGKEGKSTYDYLSQSMALQQLKDLQGMLSKKKAGNAETRAHTARVLFEIDRVMDPD